MIRFVDGVGIETEADPRHAELVTLETGTQGAKGSVTPGVSTSAKEVSSEEVVTDPYVKTGFRAIAARGLYLSVDRPDIKFATKECVRRMHAPAIDDLQSIKRLGRYLAYRPRLVRVFVYQGEYVPGSPVPREFYVCVDSNWADCKRTRKSTSGGCVKLGKHPLAEWSITQSTVSLSSGEAEFYAILRGAQEGLGLQSMALEIGFVLKLVVGSDATSAKSSCHRHGLGRLTHVQIRFLWIQEAVRQGRLRLTKENTKTNYADLFTKHLKEKRVVELLEANGYEFRHGREERAPHLLEGVAECRLNAKQQACLIAGVF